MKLVPLQDVRRSHLDQRFRQSPWAQLLATSVFVALGMGAFCWYGFGDLPLWAAYIIGAFMGLIGLIFFSTFLKSLAPGNWILAVGPEGIAVKFRSYLNAHFPQTDPQVICFTAAEVASANVTKQRITTPGSDNGNVTSFHTFLDLHIATGELSELQERLKYERTVRVETGKGIKSSSHTRHYPVSVVDGQIIRIEWRSPQDIVVPGVKKALSALNRQGVAIASLKKEVIDLTGEGDRERKRMDDKILHLAERGNLMAATKLARRAYKMSLREAKMFVEELMK